MDWKELDMATCALVGATDFNAVHFAAQRFDCVIAVDAGYASLQAIGCVPDVVVGDFDSLGYAPDVEEDACVDALHHNVKGLELISDADKVALEGFDAIGEARKGFCLSRQVSVLRFPSEKDESDMELAIAVAEEHGCDTLLLYGALAARLDHTLANLQLMVGCARRGLHVFGIGNDFAVAVLDGSGSEKLGFRSFDPNELDAGSYGRFVSLFAYGGAARGVCEQGLKYLLKDAEVPDDVSLGLSNEFIGRSVRISVSEGDAIVTFPIDAWQYLQAWDEEEICKPLPFGESGRGK